MDDWFIWFTALPQPIRDVLIGGGGGLVAQAASALLGEASGRVRRRLEPTPQQTALQHALARALVETLTARVADPLVLRELLTHFARWLERPNVALELAPLVEPNPDVTIDLAKLEAEFAAAGFAPELLGEDLEFAELMSGFVRAFYDAACLERDLQDNIELQLLRGMADRLDLLVKHAAAEQKVLEDIRALLHQFKRLDLAPLELNYLAGLYEECNDLRLIRDTRRAPGRRDGPRLQRVYVSVRTVDLPDDDILCAQLGIDAGQRQHVQAALRRALQPDGDNAGLRRDMGDRGGAQGKLAEHVQRLDEKQMARTAAAIKVNADALRAAAAPLTPFAALRHHTQLVVVGEPGSGKSMLTQRLGALLAAAASEDRDQLNDLSEPERTDLQELLAQLGRRLLPVRILLSHWKRPLNHDGQPVREACADDLIEACVRTVGETADLAAFKPEFVLRRLGGAAPTALILLDGLDEVTDAGQRAWQLAVIEHFRRRYSRVPLLVTCRVRPYQAWQTEWAATGAGLALPAFTLDSLDDDAVARFIDCWYDELLAARVYEEPDQAQAAQTRLHDAILTTAHPNHAELRKMAGRPLLLTMMAHVNYQQPLPDSRAALYARFVNQLLYEWEQTRLAPGQLTQLSQMLANVGSDIEQFKLVLAGLAHARYQAAPTRDLVDIPGLEFEERLRRLPRIDMSAGERSRWATELLEHIAVRSGLLVAPDDATYRFSHLSLQEYMTATHLVVGASDDKLQNFATVIDNPLWNEVVQLGLGILTKVLAPPQMGDALHIVDGLLPVAPLDAAGAARLLTLGEIYLHLLAVDSLNAPSRSQAHALMHKLAAHLTNLMTSKLPPPTRLRAGLLLADWRDMLARADPTQRPPDLNLDPPGLDDFIAVPGLPGVRIGKYPVTNLHFRRFVEAGAYDKGQPWWSKKAIKEIEQFVGGWPAEPRYWDDERFNHSAQPVVGVSWYEAMAYCAWLTAVLRGKPLAEGGIAVHEQVTLPSEAEWIAAARSGRPAPKTRQEEEADYPWHGPFATWRANTEENKETDLGQTSPVHMYPGGVTAEGVYDLAGNVWEWTRDVAGSNSYWLKGGSWYYSPEQARAAARDGYVPRFWYYYRGLRVVVVPVSRMSSDS